MGALQFPMMTLDEFLVWERDQERKHEFVDGVPRMMVGATLRHDRIAGGVYAFLRQTLKGKSCEPTTSDFKVVTPAGNVRYPDVAVLCGARDALDVQTREPTVVFEVLSASTAWYDQSRKLKDYQSVPSMRHIVFLSQTEPKADIWSRASSDSPFEEFALTGLDSVVDLSAVSATLALRDVYEDVER